MTPACKHLKQTNIPYSQHDYDHDPDCQHFGLEAAEKLGLPPEQVFKTLLVTDDKQYFVAIVPVTHTLSLKKMSQAVRVKKLQMADAKVAERLTGYLVGGISPIAQKKNLITRIDESAQRFSKIYVSGGKRGLDIGLCPADLLQAVYQGAFANIRDET